MYAPHRMFEALTRFVADYRSRRRRVRTERILSELSPSILRDIGWPGSCGWDDRVR